MYISDQIRIHYIKDALKKNEGFNKKITPSFLIFNTPDLTYVQADNSGRIFYFEQWVSSCWEALYQKSEYKGLKKNEAIDKFIKERFSKIANELNVQIKNYSYKNGFMSVELYKKTEDTINEHNVFLTEVEKFSKPEDKLRDPENHGGRELSYKDQMRKPQDPQRVDLIMKTVFDNKFDEGYEIDSDVGTWRVIKTISKDGKLYIKWEHEEVNEYYLETTLFPKDTNKVQVKLKQYNDEDIIIYYFEVYNIPISIEMGIKFFRKTFIPLLKKFINTQVIKLPPFNRDFIFWKTNNPDFNYSFSEPKKNKIVLELIGFIKVAEKPILDDFFIQQNLKHKQGYLQSLLDAAEDAGIFDFSREGNEILITKGVNFQKFLDGKIRKF